ncbi:unnamed protein product [Ixodes hexagonus]
MSGDSKWVPLECNPEVMTKFVRALGMPPEWSFVDVFGLEPELLSMVPTPVAAVLLLFPYNQPYKDYVEEKRKEIEESGQLVSDRVYFMHQTIKNACGAVALIHSLANCTDLIELPDSPLKNFLDATLPMNPAERGSYLEECAAIASVHEEFAQEGQTTAPSADEKVNLHFICLAKVDGCIYDLDGRKPFPVNCGPTTDETFLLDASRVCKDYIARDPENLNFGVAALVLEDN